MAVESARGWRKMRRQPAVSGAGVVTLEAASQSALAEPLVLGERRDRGKGLTAIFALDLRAAVQCWFGCVYG